MKMAEKFGRPILPSSILRRNPAGSRGARPGQKHRAPIGVRWRIEVTIMTTITGEGGRGGALAIAVAEPRLNDGELGLFRPFHPRAAFHHVARASKTEIGRRRTYNSSRSERNAIFTRSSPSLTAAHTWGGGGGSTEAAAAMVAKVLSKHFNELNASR